MKRIAIFLFLTVVLLTIPAMAQSPSVREPAFTFKSATLGMSLSNFQSANRKDVWINTGDPLKRRDKKKSQMVSAPLCTNQYDVGMGERLRSGEIGCLTSMEGFNVEARTVAGKEALYLRYFFFTERLYRITMGFYGYHFPTVLEAFMQKYGTPEKVTEEAFQNGYGARWTGEVVIWRKGKQSITLKQGPTGGPGQDGFDSVRPTTAEFLMEDLAAQVSHGDAVKVDF